jgi:NAD(P)-dependent dehydrogenase (short-subunit alcohol dehydrogenase family)
VTPTDHPTDQPTDDSQDFAGRVGIVTGAASGIGRAIATALVRRGATVVLADRNGEGAARAVGELGGGRGRTPPRWT